MVDHDPSECPAPPRKGAPGRATLAEQRIAELELRGADEDDSVVEVAAIHAEMRSATLQALIDFAKSGNFRWLVGAVAVVALAPVVILGTWAIDGGIAVDGWGCYGTATFCHHAFAPEASP